MKRHNLKLLIVGLFVAVSGMAYLIEVKAMMNEKGQAAKDSKGVIQSYYTDNLSEKSGRGIVKGESQENKGAEYAPNELIVKLKEDNGLEDIKALNEKYNVVSSEKVFKQTIAPKDVLKQLKDKLSALGAEHDKWFWQLDKDSKEYKEYAVKIDNEKEELKKQIQAQEEQIVRLEARQKRAPKGVVPPNLDNIYVLKTKGNTDVALMAADYKADPNVEYAQLNHKNVPYMAPNDPYYSTADSWGQGYDDLWGLKKINCGPAWDMSQGIGIVVAVIDTGIDYNHEDLTSNVWNNTNEIPNNGKDDDGNGYIDDVRGMDFSGDTEGTIIRDLNPMDFIGHGTHVAGIIAAVGNNGKGIIGVAPQAKVMPVKIFPNAYDSVCVDAIKYAADTAADILSNSWGPSSGDISNPVIEDAISYAYAKGCVVVFAAGNDYSDVANFSPANDPLVITVGSSDHNDKKSDFSNYGVKIDVVAPGGDSTAAGSNAIYRNILSLRAGGTDMYGDNICIVNADYYRARGTSMSCPYVSGLAAAVLANHPAFTNEEIRQVLRVSSEDIESPGFDIYAGAGRINALKALEVNSVLRVKIDSPFYGSSLDPKTNLVTITGTAAGPDFNQYELFFAPKNDLNHWAPIGQAVQTSVENDVLGTWNIRNLTTDSYVLKLAAVDFNGRQFQNYAEINVELVAKRVTTNPSSQYMPSVSNDSIVWWDFRNGNNNWDIYLYDLFTDTERQITTNTNSQARPRISGNYIVWQDNRNGNSDIYLYDLTTNTERQITTNSSAQYCPAISGNFIVWEDYRNGNSDIYLYDLTADTERRITVNSSDQLKPAISGNFIAWEDYRNGNSDIYLYDLTADTERRITTDTSSQQYPDISGERIIWQDFRNGNIDIYLYDLSMSIERQITNNLKLECYPRISGNLIVWEDTRNGNGDIYLYNLSTNTEKRLTVNLDWQRNPSILGDRIAWEDYRDGNAEIYFLALYPVLKPIGNKTISTDNLLKFEIDVSDPDNDALAYTIKNLPEGAEFLTVSQEDFEIPGLYGDLDLDGKVTNDDSLFLFENLQNLNAIQDIIADVNCDGQVDMADVTDLQYYTNNSSKLLYSTLRYGDVNIDGLINMDDVNFLLSAIGKVDGVANLTEKQKIVSDVNSDGKVDIADVTDILYYANGQMAKFTANTKRYFIWKPASTQVGVYNNINFKVTDGKEIVNESISITVIDNTAPTTPVVTDGGAYTSSKTSLYASWTSSDAETGIAQYQYRITQDSTTGTVVIKAWTSTGTTPSVTATGLNLVQGKIYYFGVKAKNSAGLWSAVGYSDGIKVDTTAPSKPVVTDEGAYTNSTTTLTANWTASSDLESGIAQYQYRITQDSTTGTEIKPWTSTGRTLSVTATGLKLLWGKTYYFGVKAKNGAGIWSAVGYSNGIKVNTPPTAPTVTGPSSGLVNTQYSFTAQTSDADDDYIHLNFIFLGTNGLEHLVAIWYNNPATQKYSWDKPGNYYVKVSAEDDKGGGSSWTKKDIVIR